MAHAATFLTEVAEIARRTPTEVVENLCDELVALRERGGPAVHSRRRRQRRQLQPCRQRFPQAVRHRGLCADRQRVGADRAHQRRGLAHGVRRVAARSAAPTPRTPCSCFSVGGGNLEKNVSPNIVAAIQEAKARGMQGVRHRRARRRLHQAGRRRGRGHSDRRRSARDAASRRRSRRWSGTASSRIRSCR